jgi:hypothetical protein
MNNDVFNMNRFGRYLVTDIKNVISRYGINLLVMVATSLTAYLLVGFFTLIVGNGWHSMTIAGRSIAMGITYLILVISAPGKIFGFITDKKEGSEYLLVPASTLEKTISMVLVCCILLPLAFLGVYLCLDQILCLIDSNCGMSLLTLLHNGRDFLNEFFRNLSNQATGLVFTNIDALSHLWLYVDDMAQSFLIFLLGALMFKSSKPAKTIGCLILLSIATSMIVTPIAMHGVIERFKDAAYVSNMSPEELMQSFPFISWTVNHPVLADTLSDTIVNVGLFIAIYFRIKKIKH